MNPTRILELANAFWSSATLLAANESGVFGALGEGSATTDELAAKLGAPARSLGMLLDALVALELLTKDGDRYRNTPSSAAFLVPGKPGSLAGALGYNARLWSAWGQLGEAVKTSRPVVPSPTYLGQDPARTRAFAMEMHFRALSMGGAIAGAVDVKGRKHLVDVGGGPGTLATILCQKEPGLRATVLELPAIAAVGEELVAKAGLADRVTFRACDVLNDDLGEGYDCALLSGLLHREPDDACAALVRRVGAALVPGGTAHLVDVMRDASRTGPPFAALFALNMLLTSERGGCHADVDHVAWLERAGLGAAKITRLPPPMVHTIVSATRP